MLLLLGTQRHNRLSVTPLWLLLAACTPEGSTDTVDASGEPGPAEDATADADEDATEGATEGATEEDICAAKDRAFHEFLSAHSSCTTADDRAVIGDCGPNADFRAVRADAADEAYALQLERCSGSWDGPVYSPTCRNRRCTLVERTDTCCGCLPSDAGL